MSIIAKIQGGLGNQMFQYAAGRSLALDKNTDLKLDLSFYDNNDERRFELSRFNIIEIKASQKEISYFQKKAPRKGILGRIFNPFFSNTLKYVNQDFTTYNPQNNTLGADVYLEGWWQSVKYFKNHEHIIKTEFTLKEKMCSYYEDISHKAASTESVALHIRRGDYVSNPYTNKVHGVLPLEYYIEALETVTSRTTITHIFVFSDDIPWAKENLQTNLPIIFVDSSENKDYEELVTMSYCKHFIIANSSFSWWAAQLGKNKEKIVIAPKKWFNKNIDSTNFVPSEWIRI